MHFTTWGARDGVKLSLDVNLKRVAYDLQAAVKKPATPSVAALFVPEYGLYDFLTTIFPTL
jgi:hypothetical protein